VVKLRELCAGKRVVLFAVPGAFTPGCSEVHLPGFLKLNAELRQHCDEVICVSCNDGFVMSAEAMSAWAKDRQAEGKVRMLADCLALSLTAALGMSVDMTKTLGSVRSRRYSMIIDAKGTITHLNVEPKAGVTVSGAETALQQLSELAARKGRL
jgi:peroxiredoxin